MILRFTSVNGGSGSSTILTLISHRLVFKGNSVAVVDLADSKFQDIYLGFDLEINNELSEVEETNFIDEEGKSYPILYNADINDDIGVINEKLEILDRHFDFILIDSGTFTGNALENNTELKSHADILVITQDNGSIRAADRVINSYDSDRISKVKFLINKFIEADINDMASVNDIFNIIEVDYLGSVSYSPDLRFSVNKGKINESSEVLMLEIDSIINTILNNSHESDMDFDTPSDEDELDLLTEEISEINESGAVDYQPHPESDEKPEEEEKPETEMGKSVGILERLKNFFKR